MQQRTRPDVEFGIYSLADISTGQPPSQRVRDIVEFGVFADQMGLDVFGVGEHHTPRFAVPSPAVVLAAVAARTSSITLTSAVSVLSVLDPVRLYQDFAQLDLVSDGRAEITVGRSAYSEPFDIFGVDINLYDDVFTEKLGLLRQLSIGENITWTGQFRPPLNNVTIVPHLDHTLPVRIGVGGSPESASRAGYLGLPMTLAHLGGSLARVHPTVDRYRRAGADAGHAPLLDVALASHLFVGTTSQGARETFYPYYRSYFAAGRGVHLDRTTFDAMAAPDGALVVGSAHEVADKLSRQRELLGVSRFIGQVDLGGLPRTHVLESIDQFASHVAPSVRNN